MFDEAQVVDVNAKIDDENIHVYNHFMALKAEENNSTEEFEVGKIMNNFFPFLWLKQF